MSTIVADPQQWYISLCSDQTSPTGIKNFPDALKISTTDEIRNKIYMNLHEMTVN